VNNLCLSHIFRHGWLALLILLSGISSSTLHAAPRQPAKQPATPKNERPFFVLNFAGLNRWLKDVDAVTTEINRPDLATAVRGLLALTGNLQGIDHEKPFGLMAFINPGEIPEPVAVIFLPVTNIEKIQGTLKQISTARLSPVAKSQNRYTLQFGSQSFHVLYQNGYAFIARKPVSLKRRLPNPAADFSQQTKQYDLAIQLNLAEVPRGMKTMIFDYLRAANFEKLERRNHESPADHRLRRLIANSTLALLSRIARDGKRLTFGWNLAEKNRQAMFDIHLDALPNTRLSRAFKHVSSGKSLFSQTGAGKHPLDLRMSWMCGKEEKNILSSTIQFTGQKIQRSLMVPATQKTQAALLTKRLLETVELGHANLAVQLRNNNSQKTTPTSYTLLAGTKFAGSKVFSQTLSEHLKTLKRNSDIKNLKTTNSKQGNTRWNQFRLSHISENEKRILGDSPSVVLGSNSSALWFAMGGEITRATPWTTFRPLATSVRKPARRGTLFQLTMRMSHWLPILFPGKSRDNFVEIASRSLKPERDGVRIELLVNSQRMTFHSRFDSGFIHFAASLALRTFQTR
jgi:hypothetical protein